MAMSYRRQEFNKIGYDSGDGGEKAGQEVALQP